jgi:hypothetical protein
MEILLQIARYPVSQAGIPVKVLGPLKETAECSQEAVFGSGHLGRLYIQFHVVQLRFLPGKQSSL